MALEFATAVQIFVSSTLLPIVARDLHAGHHLGLLLVGSTIGLFVALPLAGRVVARLGALRTLSLGMAGSLTGALVAATARAAWAFAAGQFLTGVAGGLLAVFGVSAVIARLDGELRVRVVAASSAMWILPALVGPPVTLAVEHLVGWRWALLLPVPIVIVGRLLVLAAARPGAGTQDAAGQRPVGRTLLVPLGVAVLVVGSASAAGWPAALVGTAIALAGVAGLLPCGTGRVARGTPAALAAMLLFATGYLGADGLVTVLLTDGYRVSVAKAAMVLSAAPLAWATASLGMPRLVRTRGSIAPTVLGLALAAAGAGGLAAFAAGGVFPAALGAWTLGGIGIGLAYPGLYLLCTTAATGSSSATELATAVITAESFGALLGRAVGGAVVSAAVAAHLAPSTGLIVTYGMFAALLVLAAVAAARAGPLGARVGGVRRAPVAEARS